MVFLFIGAISYSQTYVSMNQSMVVQQNTTIVNGPDLSFVAYELSAWRNMFDNKRRREEAQAKAQMQILSIKSLYNESSKFPDKITDGWHQVFATNNFSFCSPAKVLISDNKITKFVLGNWTKLSRQFVVISPINKGKSILSADLGDENMETLELLFMNDLVESSVTEPPRESGFIAYYSDCSKAKSTKIWFEDKYYGELKKEFKKNYVPSCDENGTLLLEVCPDKTYFFKAAGRGTISWRGNVVAKENMCLKYVLNQENRF